MWPFTPNDLVLFQGDSITDAGRSREDDSQMGAGYASLLAAWLSAQWPQGGLRFLNRGISGDRACDLEARWTRDCIDLQPDWVSILIGINDTWRRYDSGTPSDIGAFEQTYERLLTRVRDESAARVIILEPFVAPVTPEQDTWREDLDPRIQAVRRVARTFGAFYVPLDGLFAAASVHRGPSFWASDGVHPTPAGHALIAQHWLRTLQTG